MEVDLYFSEYYEIDPPVLEEHGAFDISVVSDLPLFVDPFLLFKAPIPSTSGSTRRSCGTCGSSATRPCPTSTRA